MKVQRSVAIKYTLGIVAICLYALGALLGLVMTSVSSWQYSRYADNPNFLMAVYSPDIKVVLILFLVAGLLLLLVSSGGVLFSVLFLVLKRSRGAGVALGVLGTGIVTVLTLEVIASTVQWEHWQTQSKVLPGILENEIRNAEFSPDDWFGRELAWFQDTFQCCGYSNGTDFSNGPGAQFAVLQATNQSASPIPSAASWRPRSCCDDFTVGDFDCTEQIASYNMRDNLGTEGCGVLWLRYLASNQRALVGLAIAGQGFQLVLVQIPLWLLAFQLVYARKEGGLLEEE